jgi:Tol biopolymer transport system component
MSIRKHVRPVPSVLVGFITVFTGLVLAIPAQAANPGTDGEISYVRQAAGARADLYSMNSNGSEKGRLTRSQTVGEATPSWSPTGALLAFQGIRDGDRRIFVRNAATGVVRQVSSGPSADRFPTWSPNSRTIAYRSLRCRTCEGGIGDGDIYSVGRRGGARVKLTTQAGINTDPAWSPDGARIAFASNTDGNYDIYVMNADGSNVIQLTNDGAGPPAISNRFPNWSPDGMSIAYVSTRNNQNEEIYVMDVSGGFVLNPPTTRLTTNPAIDRSPSWSPSGAKIAFTSNRDGDYDIWSMNAADGSGLAKLTTGAAKETEPTWQPLVGCTIVGTNGNNSLNGTAGADVICALGGNDTIGTGGGADRIYGGPGDDAISSGSGNDTLNGGRGGDVLRSGAGRDRLFGADGNDTFVTRDRQRDRLDGGPGRDRARADRRLDRRVRIEVLF